jgi:ABC-type dipeptide/oligopeptide/nickel transport system ATPase subunit
VKVIAYDRIIEDSDLDYYITFDMLGVGKLQAQYLLNIVPKGRYYLLAGPKEDNNARLFRQGQMMVLQAKIDSGDVKVVGDQWAGGWLPENAMKLTENVLTATPDRRHPGFQRQHRPGRHPGAQGAGLGGQDPHHRAGCRPGHLPGHFGWRADHVGVQAAAQAGRGRHPAGLRRGHGKADKDQRHLQTEEWIRRLKLDGVKPGTRVKSLGIGKQQLIEIARVLRLPNRRILILDEPTASLTESETELLLDILRQLKRDGIACIYISHKI